MKDTGRLTRVAAPWIILTVVLAFYGRVLGRGFTSEDFLLVRFLGENPPWQGLVSLFTSPWLEISVVKFWRPVSTLLYGLEIAAFGGDPVGYNVVHMLVHAGNAVLVWAIARRLGRGLPEPDEVAPLAAALLFAVYPLHPNAVIWSASFATLFAATFLLAALLVYLRFRESGTRCRQILALGLFALGLGSYEAAVVFPLVLASCDHLLGVRIGSRRHLSLVPGYLPFFLLMGLYLLLRKSLFGVFVGGYEEQGRNLLSPELGPLLRDLAASILWLHVPVYDRTPGPLALAVSCVLLVGVPLAFVALRRRSGDGSHLRLWLFGWIWTLAALAPFAFRPSVPANGRYWYLAAAGVALSLSSLLRSRRSSLASAGLVVAGLFWGVLLHGYLGVHREAGETARAVQQELVRSGASAPAARRFLTGHPDFLRNGIGIPVAQVLRYGVWDSVHLPFVETSVSVYPLPPLQGNELLPIVRGAPGSRIDVWDAQSRKIRPAVEPPAGAEPAELEVVGPAPGAAFDPARQTIEVRVPPGLAARFGLIVVARGNGTAIELGPEAAQGGILQASLPDEFCRTMVRLYGEHEMFWWIEARDAAGGLAGFTPLRSFRISK